LALANETVAVTFGRALKICQSCLKAKAKIQFQQPCSKQPNCLTPARDISKIYFVYILQIGSTGGNSSPKWQQQRGNNCLDNAAMLLFSLSGTMECSSWLIQGAK